MLQHGKKEATVRYYTESGEDESMALLHQHDQCITSATLMLPLLRGEQTRRAGSALELAAPVSDECFSP